MMEKNGNTVSAGDKVFQRNAADKVASHIEGTVCDVDVAEELALVKWAHGVERWVPLSALEKA